MEAFQNESQEQEYFDEDKKKNLKTDYNPEIVSDVNEILAFKKSKKKKKIVATDIETIESIPNSHEDKKSIDEFITKSLLIQALDLPSPPKPPSGEEETQTLGYSFMPSNKVKNPHLNDIINLNRIIELKKYKKWEKIQLRNMKIKIIGCKFMVMFSKVAIKLIFRASFLDILHLALSNKPDMLLDFFEGKNKFYSYYLLGFLELSGSFNFYELKNIRDILDNILIEYQKLDQEKKTALKNEFRNNFYKDLKSSDESKIESSEVDCSNISLLINKIKSRIKPRDEYNEPLSFVKVITSNIFENLSPQDTFIFFGDMGKLTEIYNEKNPEKIKHLSNNILYDTFANNGSQLVETVIKSTALNSLASTSIMNIFNKDEKPYILKIPGIKSTFGILSQDNQYTLPFSITENVVQLGTNFLSAKVNGLIYTNPDVLFPSPGPSDDDFYQQKLKFFKKSKKEGYTGEESFLLLQEKFNLIDKNDTDTFAKLYKLKGGKILNTKLISGLKLICKVTGAIAVGSMLYSVFSGTFNETYDIEKLIYEPGFSPQYLYNMFIYKFSLGLFRTLDDICLTFLKYRLLSFHLKDYIANHCKKYIKELYEFIKNSLKILKQKMVVSNKTKMYNLNKKKYIDNLIFNKIFSISGGIISSIFDMMTLIVDGLIYLFIDMIYYAIPNVSPDNLDIILEPSQVYMLFWNLTNWKNVNTWSEWLTNLIEYISSIATRRFQSNKQYLHGKLLTSQLSKKDLYKSSYNLHEDSNLKWILDKIGGQEIFVSTVRNIGTSFKIKEGYGGKLPKPTQIEGKIIAFDAKHGIIIDKTYNEKHFTETDIGHILNSLADILINDKALCNALLTKDCKNIKPDKLREDIISWIITNSHLPEQREKILEIIDKLKVETQSIHYENNIIQRFLKLDNDEKLQTLNGITKDEKDIAKLSQNNNLELESIFNNIVIDSGGNNKNMLESIKKGKLIISAKYIQSLSKILTEIKSDEIRSSNPEEDLIKSLNIQDSKGYKIFTDLKELFDKIKAINPDIKIIFNKDDDGFYESTLLDGEREHDLEKKTKLGYKNNIEQSIANLFFNGNKDYVEFIDISIDGENLPEQVINIEKNEDDDDLSFFNLLKKNTNLEEISLEQIYENNYKISEALFYEPDWAYTMFAKKKPSSFYLNKSYPLIDYFDERDLSEYLLDSIGVHFSLLGKKHNFDALKERLDVLQSKMFQYDYKKLPDIYIPMIQENDNLFNLESFIELFKSEQTIQNIFNDDLSQDNINSHRILKKFYKDIFNNEITQKDLEEKLKTKGSLQNVFNMTDRDIYDLWGKIDKGNYSFMDSIKFIINKYFGIDQKEKLIKEFRAVNKHLYDILNSLEKVDNNIFLQSDNIENQLRENIIFSFEDYLKGPKQLLSMKFLDRFKTNFVKKGVNSLGDKLIKEMEILLNGPSIINIDKVDAEKREVFKKFGGDTEFMKHYKYFDIMHLLINFIYNKCGREHKTDENENFIFPVNENHLDIGWEGGDFKLKFKNILIENNFELADDKINVDLSACLRNPDIELIIGKYTSYVANRKNEPESNIFDILKLLFFCKEKKWGDETIKYLDLSKVGPYPTIQDTYDSNGQPAGESYKSNMTLKNKDKIKETSVSKIFEELFVDNQGIKYFDSKEEPTSQQDQKAVVFDFDLTLMKENLFSKYTTTPIAQIDFTKHEFAHPNIKDIIKKILDSNNIVAITSSGRKDIIQGAFQHLFSDEKKTEDKDKWKQIKILTPDVKKKDGNNLFTSAKDGDALGHQWTKPVNKMLNLLKKDYSIKNNADILLVDHLINVDEAHKEGFKTIHIKDHFNEIYDTTLNKFLKLSIDEDAAKTPKTKIFEAITLKGSIFEFLNENNIFPEGFLDENTIQQFFKIPNVFFYNLINKTCNRQYLFYKDESEFKELPEKQQDDIYKIKCAMHDLLENFTLDENNKKHINQKLDNIVFKHDAVDTDTQHIYIDELLENNFIKFFIIQSELRDISGINFDRIIEQNIYSKNSSLLDIGRELLKQLDAKMGHATDNKVNTIDELFKKFCIEKNISMDDLDLKKFIVFDTDSPIINDDNNKLEFIKKFNKNFSDFFDKVLEYKKGGYKNLDLLIQGATILNNDKLDTLESFKSLNSFKIDSQEIEDYFTEIEPKIDFSAYLSLKAAERTATRIPFLNQYYLQDLYSRYRDPSYLYDDSKLLDSVNQSLTSYMNIHCLIKKYIEDEKKNQNLSQINRKFSVILKLIDFKKELLVGFQQRQNQYVEFLDNLLLLENKSMYASIHDTTTSNPLKTPKSSRDTTVSTSSIVSSSVDVSTSVSTSKVSARTQQITNVVDANILREVNQMSEKMSESVKELEQTLEDIRESVLDDEKESQNELLLLFELFSFLSSGNNYNRQGDGLKRLFNNPFMGSGITVPEIDIQDLDYPNPSMSQMCIKYSTQKAWRPFGFFKGIQMNPSFEKQEDRLKIQQECIFSNLIVYSMEQYINFYKRALRLAIRTMNVFLQVLLTSLQALRRLPGWQWVKVPIGIIEGLKKLLNCFDSIATEKIVRHAYIRKIKEKVENYIKDSDPIKKSQGRLLATYLVANVNFFDPSDLASTNVLDWFGKKKIEGKDAVAPKTIDRRGLPIRHATKRYREGEVRGKEGIFKEVKEPGQDAVPESEKTKMKIPWCEITDKAISYIASTNVSLNDLLSQSYGSELVSSDDPNTVPKFYTGTLENQDNLLANVGYNVELNIDYGQVGKNLRLDFLEMTNLGKVINDFSETNVDIEVTAVVKETLNDFLSSLGIGNILRSFYTQSTEDKIKDMEIKGIKLGIENANQKYQLLKEQARTEVNEFYQENIQQIASTPKMKIENIDNIYLDKLEHLIKQHEPETKTIDALLKDNIKIVLDKVLLSDSGKEAILGRSPDTTDPTFEIKNKAHEHANEINDLLKSKMTNDSTFKESIIMEINQKLTTEGKTECDFSVEPLDKDCKNLLDKKIKEKNAEKISEAIISGYEMSIYDVIVEFMNIFTDLYYRLGTGIPTKDVWFAKLLPLGNFDEFPDDYSEILFNEGFFPFLKKIMSENNTFQKSGFQGYEDDDSAITYIASISNNDDFLKQLEYLLIDENKFQTKFLAQTDDKIRLKMLQTLIANDDIEDANIIALSMGIENAKLKKLVEKHNTKDRRKKIFKYTLHLVLNSIYTDEQRTRLNITEIIEDIMDKYDKDFQNQIFDCVYHLGVTWSNSCQAFKQIPEINFKTESLNNFKIAPTDEIFKEGTRSFGSIEEEKKFSGFISSETVKVTMPYRDVSTFKGQYIDENNQQLEDLVMIEPNEFIKKKKADKFYNQFKKLLIDSFIKKNCSSSINTTDFSNIECKGETVNFEESFKSFIINYYNSNDLLETGTNDTITEFKKYLQTNFDTNIDFKDISNTEFNKFNWIFTDLLTGLKNDTFKNTWSVLTVEQKETAEKLNWNQQYWDNNYIPVKLQSPWSKLNEEQKSDLEKLNFNTENWMWKQINFNFLLGINHKLFSKVDRKMIPNIPAPYIFNKNIDQDDEYQLAYFNHLKVEDNEETVDANTGVIKELFQPVNEDLFKKIISSGQFVNWDDSSNKYKLDNMYDPIEKQKGGFYEQKESPPWYNWSGDYTNYNKLHSAEGLSLFDRWSLFSDSWMNHWTLTNSDEFVNPNDAPLNSLDRDIVKSQQFQKNGYQLIPQFDDNRLMNDFTSELKREENDNFPNSNNSGGSKLPRLLTRLNPLDPQKLSSEGVGLSVNIDRVGDRLGIKLKSEHVDDISDSHQLYYEEIFKHLKGGSKRNSPYSYLIPTFNKDKKLDYPNNFRELWKDIRIVQNVLKEPDKPDNSNVMSFLIKDDHIEPGLTYIFKEKLKNKGLIFINTTATKLGVEEIDSKDEDELIDSILASLKQWNVVYKIPLPSILDTSKSDINENDKLDNKKISDFYEKVGKFFILKKDLATYQSYGFIKKLENGGYELVYDRSKNEEPFQYVKDVKNQYKNIFGDSNFKDWFQEKWSDEDIVLTAIKLNNIKGASYNPETRVFENNAGSSMRSYISGKSSTKNIITLVDYIKPKDVQFIIPTAINGITYDGFKQPID